MPYLASDSDTGDDVQKPRETGTSFPQLRLKLIKKGQAQSQLCWARDVGMQGLFASGAHALVAGEKVRLEINPLSHEGLPLNARVVSASAHGAVCHFEDNSARRLEELAVLLTPTPVGDYLLDGVIKLAPWHSNDGLASWMRLTSLVSGWQRLARKPST
jgi:hypothetical protein